MRIHVTGNAGSGKTTLAAELGRRLDLPVYGLDAVVWQPGWRTTPHALRVELESELAAGDAWVIEGVSPRIRSAADLVIFLDLPRWLCLARCLRRCLFHPGGRAELPSDCPEWRILPYLLPLVWQFPRRARPAILSHPGLVRLASTGQIRNFVLGVSFLRRRRPLDG